MKIVELILDPTDEQSGIEAISVVETPAIEENFIALNKTAVLILKCRFLPAQANNFMVVL